MEGTKNMETAIRFEVGNELAIVPLWLNYENEKEMTGEAKSDKQAFDELTEYWGGLKWGYYEKASGFELVEHEMEDEVVTCHEFGVYLYASDAYKRDFYDRPFDDEAEVLVFLNCFAADCHQGLIYSKDFGYYDCDGCGRLVCGQNPSNGWMSQVHFGDSSCECNKCYKERVLEYGVNDDFDGEAIPGQFFNYADIEKAGWELVEEGVLAGSGRVGYKDPKYAIGLIDDLIKKGKRVLVNYENMAIGGMGGYVSIYVK